MKMVTLACAMTLAGATYTHAQQPTTPPSTPENAQPARPSGKLQPKVAPGLAKYTDEILFGEVWPGSGLSLRDRSLTVITVLIATNKPAVLPGHLGRALTNGLTPVEASGVLAHLALYAGWPSAVSALEVYDKVYTERKVDFEVVRKDVESLMPSDSDTAAAAAVTAQFGAVAPRFTDLTNRVVFGDLWLRTDLSIRDRSLVTIVALAALGDTELLEPYLRRGVEAGLTREEIAEALTQLAFYAGWGKATKAMTVVSETLKG